MSLSKECQEFHLTPSGWIEGSFHGDALGGEQLVDPPNDRVLTIGCYDELAAAFAKAHFYEQVLWRCKDEAGIAKLKRKYGERPDWFGYAKMKH